MKKLFASLAIIFYSGTSWALTVSCQTTDEEIAYSLNGEISVEKNEEPSTSVYSIAENGKITVIESSEGIEYEQKIFDSLKWKKQGSGFLGTGFVEIDGYTGTGSQYIDETIEITTVIIDVDGQLVAATGSSKCKRVN